MLRLFLALALPPPIPSSCVALQSILRQRFGTRHLPARFPRSEQLHLTTKFLGPFPQGKVPDLVSALRTKLDTSTAITSATGPLGAFPRITRAQVVVLHLSDESGALEALARGCDAVAHEFGVPLETRPFKPHVTLARLRRPSNIEAGLQGLAPNATAFRFEQLALWSSKLDSAGSTYTKLHTWTLEGD